MSMAQEKDSIANRKVISNNSALQRTIIGTVTDQDLLPLPGVNVVIEGSTIGTQTDFDGNYSIKASKGQILIFSYIGQKTVSKMVDEDNIINIKMEQDSQALEEVVVTGISKSEQEGHLKFPCLNATRLVGDSKYDSRFEKFQLDSLVDWQASIRKITESVAIIVEKESLYAVSDQEYQLDLSNTLEEVYNLCSDQNFVDQPVLGKGTGFIVGPDTMLTARHVFERPIEDYRIIFGFEILGRKDEITNSIVASRIFYPRSIEQEFDELDIVAFKVDRAFDKPPLDWENSRKLKNESEIYMVGHPSGLPKKIALNAGIVDNTKFQFFFTSLDGFQGNSGSPIFNFCTNKVVGVLVSGELDYQFNGNCYETTLCKFPFCKGEKVIRIENIMKNLN